MLRGRAAKVAAGLVVVAGLAAGVGAAWAQQAPAAGANANNAWIKICNRDPQQNRDICLTAQELRTDSGQFLASIAIRATPGEARKSLLVSVPVGMLIQPKVQLVIDAGQPTPVDYTICFPNACYAEAVIDDAFIGRLKAGGKLALVTFNQQGRQVRFDMTLIGFTSAFDGPGIDPQALEAQQANLQRELDRRAEEARNRLVADQQRAVEQATQAQ